MKEWIEAMRLRTLPVSVAGVIAGTACAIHHHGFATLPFLICLLFAVLAQITSNFANEYYDFKNGLDRKGREGFRRGVTEGDIKPQSMKKATYLTLLAAICVGSTLVIWGGWWLLFVGLAVAIFALAYSTGPFPLSHNGLGEIAVIVFFGFVPVIFTQYVQTRYLYLDSVTVFTAAAIGLMAANVLIVNNYRDVSDDRNVGKKTSVVILGEKIMSGAYYTAGILAAIFLAMASSPLPFWVSAGWLTYFTFHTVLWGQLKTRSGAALNEVLKSTSLLLLCVSIYLLIIFATLKPDPAGEFFTFS
ncbi:MAG: 1,4-dihydroxy-2-naphthoate octaprenyltransferase [Muribaculaceae bacterium]|nr:1,4-dihydroxy-2-naphthoate octaprenyltransferase [Muribaculaceae bacterium]